MEVQPKVGSVGLEVSQLAQLGHTLGQVSWGWELSGLGGSPTSQPAQTDPNLAQPFWASCWCSMYLAPEVFLKLNETTDLPHTSILTVQTRVVLTIFNNFLIWTVRIALCTKWGSPWDCHRKFDSNHMAHIYITLELRQLKGEFRIDVLYAKVPTRARRSWNLERRARVGTTIFLRSFLIV